MASPGKAMRLFKALAQTRNDFGWLQRDTQRLLDVRHFVAHAVFEEDAIVESKSAIFILSPRIGETMLTIAQADNNARMIQEARTRIWEAIRQYDLST